MTPETRTELVERLREAEQCFINLADNPSDGMLERAEAVSYAIAALEASPPSLPTAREVLEELRGVLDSRESDYDKATRRSGDATYAVRANETHAVLAIIDTKLAALSSQEPPTGQIHTCPICGPECRC